MQMEGTDDSGLNDVNEFVTLNVQDIDASWLQRKISQAFVDIDAQQSRELSEEVLSVVDDELDEQNIENKLAMLLGYEKFDLIKLLVYNRLKIVLCTRLARAEDHEERKNIEDDMTAAGSSHDLILEQLCATRASVEERQKNLEKSITEEARRLMDEQIHGCYGDIERTIGEADSGWSTGHCQILPLETLAFNESGLLMYNQKCVLPAGSYRTQHKGYEEVFILALKPKRVAEGELVKISTPE